MISKKRSKEIFLISLFFIGEFILFRYYRGPRLRGYFLFLDPFLELLICYAFYLIFLKYKFVTVVLLVLIGIISFRSEAKVLARGNDASELFAMRDYLKLNFPGEKFHLFTNHPYAGACSFNLALILDSASMTSRSGRPLDMCVESAKMCSQDPNLIASAHFGRDNCLLLDPSNDSNFKAKNGRWQSFDRTDLFDEVENWWRKK